MLENYSVAPKFSWLTWFFRGLIALAAIVLIGRLAELQIIKGAYYRDLADGNRAREVNIQAPRGKILARGGEVIVESNKIPKTVKFNPEAGYEKVEPEPDTPEDEILYEWQRTYPLAESAGHITGYLGEVNAEELGKVDQSCRDKGVKTLGSYVGRIGLEAYYDCYLRGVDGEEIVEVDIRGNKVRILGRRPAIPGRDLTTTIDYKFQKKLAEILEGKNTAAIVSKPNGEILAIHSSPSFDPNAFIEGDREKINSFFSDENLPLFNRAIGGVYHPGSIYKILVSTASLEDDVIESDYEYIDTGIVSVDEYEYTNWYFTQYGGTEGEVDTVRALARSTDTFYYKLGEQMGVDRIVDWSERFGLKDKTNIDLPGEVTGLVPSPEWKKAIKGERWFLGNTYHLSIGQGDLTTTPISAHRIASVIANDGKLCDMRLTDQKDESCRDLDITAETLAVIKEGMREACAPGGTAFPFFDFEPVSACKTGTAETFEEDVTHAWFTIFAPIEDPEIVMTVLVEKGGGGSDVAAPIAREMLDYIFNP